MPIVQGYHVPKIENDRIRPKQFNVLLLDLSFNQLSTIAIYVSTLHNYLDTLNMHDYRLRIHVANSLPNLRALIAMYPCLSAHELDADSKDAILGLAKSLDVDIILDEKDKFTDQERAANSDKLAIVRYFNPEFNDLLNSICAGWNIPWNFRDPIWNASWIAKYLEPTTSARKAFDFMGSSQKQNYSEDQKQIVRNLSNKLSQVNHCRQLLDYTLILRRYAKRHELKAEDVLFELSYQLNNYFVLISGSLDILARLINDVYQLNFKPYESYTLSSNEFLNRLEKKRKGLFKILRLKKYSDWMDWLGQRRNLLAHQSYLYLTSLVQRKKNPLTEAEIEEKVNASRDWAIFSSSGLPSNLIEQLKEFKKFQIDLEENHETIAEDIMPIDMRNRKTKTTQRVIYFPLKAIDDDYKKVNEIVSRVLDNLSHARAIR